MKIINQEQKEFWNEKKGDIWVSLEHNIDKMLGPLGDQAIKILNYKEPRDFIVSTGQAYSVRDFCKITFDKFELNFIE